MDEKLHQFVEWALEKYTGLDLHDYTALLHLAKGYSILEVEVQQGHWLGGHTLAELELSKEGVLVLGIRRQSGDYVGAPTATTKVNFADTLTLYGKLERLEELNRRKTGVAGLYARQAAMDEHEQEREESDSDSQENLDDEAGESRQTSNAGA